MVENLGLVPISPTNGFLTSATGGTGSTNFSNNSTGDTLGNSQSLRLRVTAATTTGNYSYVEMWLPGEIIGVEVRSDSAVGTLWVDGRTFRIDGSAIATAASVSGYGNPSNSFTFIPRDRWGNPIIFNKRMKRVRVSVACDATATQDVYPLAFLVPKEYGRQMALQSNLTSTRAAMPLLATNIPTANYKGFNSVSYFNTDSLAHVVTIMTSAGAIFKKFYLAATGTTGDSAELICAYGSVGSNRGGWQHLADDAKVFYVTHGVAGGVG